MAGRLAFRLRRRGAGRIASAPPTPRCGSCRYFHNEPGMLERTFRGLTVLSSAYGSARGDAGLCVKRELFLSPGHGCREHAPRTGSAGEPHDADR